MADAEMYSLYQNAKKDKSSAWLLFLLLGFSYGYLGNMPLQILYYLTFGGLGIWTIYLLFTYNSKINEANTKIAQKIGFDNKTIELLVNG